MNQTHPGITYEVDVSIGLCICPAGISGRCCKHQIAVFTLFEQSIPNCPPVTGADQYAACMGDKVLLPEFYERFSLQWSQCGGQVESSTVTISRGNAYV